ncbi:fructose-bisphosphate aldolase, class I [Strigomonas culicis]|uniref:Fructose-bisphosphate aldolase n=1 Tax=Strigomonas culicis TaxID=28005 RepID=S9UD98_9TRYP|nr:fructose-bisphosphate aldolase, class I [Strigomonas culicis]EPY26699.1 fructose-bisphosphate aldolase, class I [Strigomonas culicis]|eukprot:EPY26100.1 fructose-bisphosphate aldolase, class I [Strigomonas culicis]
MHRTASCVSLSISSHRLFVCILSLLFFFSVRKLLVLYPCSFFLPFITMSDRVQVLQTQLPAYNRIKTPFEAELRATVKKMTAPGKGLLAADESIGSCTKRFEPIGLSNTEEHRRQYRALMLEAEGFEKYISGVILHDETVYQKASNGQTFPEYLVAKGVVAGIKTDMGLNPLLEGADGEQMTEGLDGYLKRAQKYYKAGCRFCKWRNVYKIQNGTVSESAVRFNAETLARYAILSQMSGIVPIVEPEVMIDGTHDIETSQRVSEHVWSEVINALHRHGVIWEGCLLKPNMVVPGAESGKKATPEEAATATITALSRTIPPALPGITFLSGGLSEVQATEYLNAMNQSKLPRPWNLSFSYARALQSSALKAWGGKDSGVAAGRKAFLHRARMNSLAQLGKYDRKEDDKESQSLYVKGNTY